MKLYINPDTGTTFRSSESALRSTFIEFTLDDDDDIQGDCFFAVDREGGRIISPFTRDIVDWCVGRHGVSIRMLDVQKPKKA